MRAVALLLAAAAPTAVAQTQTQAGAIVLREPVLQGALVHGNVPWDLVSPTIEGHAVLIAADGALVLGFDRDAAAIAQLVARFADAHTLAQALAVAPRGWSISHLPTLPKYPVTAPEFAARRPAELARIAAAHALPVASNSWRQRFMWPVTGRISTLFGSQRMYRGGEADAYHSGIDIARATGTIIVAPADGVAILAADAPSRWRAIC